MENSLIQTQTNEPFFTEGELEVRSTEGGKTVVYGYAALFNQRSRTLTTKRRTKFVEEILPGAFDGTDFSDAVCYFDHEKRDLLASVPNLRHGVDARGLWYEYDHDPTDPIHVTALCRIQRRDAKGSSFQFPPLTPDCYTVTRTEGGLLMRSIKKIPMVFELGPVITPAYRGTTTHARSLGIDDFDIEPAESRDMSGAYNANTNPTPAQKESGNYKKGKVRVHGMEISIENPIGSMRSGTDANGNVWQREMFAHYGYILGSKATDGDNLDVFLTDSAEFAALAFVVDQINPDGTFDEHKCLIGPGTIQEAAQLYLSHYSDGWTGLGAICPVPIPCFYAWAMDGKVKRQPLMYGVVEDARNTGGNSLESDGNNEEQQRNAGGTPLESSGNLTEEQRNAAELAKKLEERKLKVRATLI